LNTLISFLALPQAIPIGTHIIGCMAQITNTLSSADSTPMTLSTTLSDDEDAIDDHPQFHSIIGFNFPKN
jgi:hypothetical protein